MKLRHVMRTFAMAAMATVLTCVVLAPVGAAAAPGDNAVQRWNATALTALFASPAAAVPGAGQAPTVGVIHMAMVQGAVFDAVNSIAGRYESYLDVPDAKDGASVSAAVITAAHDVLIEVIPMSDASIRDAILARIEEQYTTELAAIPSGPAKRRGVSAGATAAAAMLADRAEDGRYPADPFTFTTGTGIGEWRPTNDVNDPFAWVARVRPFTLRSTSQFRTAGPNPVTSEAYAAEYNEVKTLGAATDSSRTEEQTALATFYLANPVEMFNRTFRTIAADEALGQVRQARLFAMLNVAGADAAINCWDDKAEYNYWRPVTAIHLGDEDDNPATEGDASWQPLISAVPGAQPGTFLATPPYPEHPSGYNCITAAMIHAGRLFFGTNEMSFTVTRIAGTSTTSRDYTTFTAVVQDTIDARIFLGIHFRVADVQGATIGKKVARWIAERFFEPEGR
ncbi:MAG TPA: vanadium-dependent haloperoxidase [Actinomycetota bacterium]|nr:vanadium-dependent haloperoxidase [Actinomycetota bacterium]